MKKTIFCFIATFFILGLSSCSNSDDDVFYLAITNSCKDEINGFYYEYSLNSEPIGTGTIGYDDKGAVSLGDTLYTSFVPKDFNNRTNLSGFRIQLWVITSDGREVSAGNIWDMPASYGNIYSFTVSGSETDGYAAEYNGDYDASILKQE